MKKLISRLRYGVPYSELRHIMRLWQQNKTHAILYCKMAGYKTLTQKLQQRL